MDHLKHARLHRGDQHGDESNKQKRTSLTFRPSSKSRSSDTASPRAQAQQPPRVKIDLLIESPPLVFYGSTRQSTGALLSGRIIIGVQSPHDEVQVASLSMQLRGIITVKKSVSKDCPHCQQRANELQKWDLMKEPKTVKKGDEIEFPLSYLFDGGLPATVTDAPLGAIQYFLDLSARTVAGEETKVRRELKIQRAIPAGPDRTAIRIFPPTNLAGRCVMPNVIHPIGAFPIELILSGVVDKRDKAVVRWRLRKVMWRIEEQSRMVSHACPKHADKVGGPDKGRKHEDVHTIGSGEMKEGWKTDFDTAGGEITLQFEANLTASKRPVCDTDTEGGFFLSHSLIIETIVSEERSTSAKRVDDIQSTGAARILRMSFAMPVTNREGMGISWDEEIPPMYREVPASPPVYPKFSGAATETSVMEDYRGGFEWENDTNSPRPGSGERPIRNSSGRDSGDCLPSDLPPSYRSHDAFPPLDQLRDHEDPAFDGSGPGPGTITERARARGQWTLDELEVEPPQSFLRRNETDRTNEPEDISVGQHGPSEAGRT
ncbi:MAG: hypothetical protein Q9160_001964 [Pyrenula sp. 1 TL-2023]